MAILLLVLAPEAIPKAMRSIGRYVGLLRKMGKDVEDQIITPMRGEAPEQPRGGRGPRNEAGPSDPFRQDQAHKLETLDRFLHDYNPNNAHEALLWLLDDDPAVSQKARDVLFHDPLFVFGHRDRHRRDPDPDRQFSKLEEYFRSRRIDDLSVILNRIPDDRLERNLKSLCELPGIARLDLERVFSGTKERMKERFLQALALAEKEHYPRQIFFSPTYHCNMGCSYCFTHALERRFPRDMTPAELGELIDRASHPEPLERIGFLGGEPTISPNIGGYLEEIEKRKLALSLTTNGLAPVETFKRVAATDCLKMVTFHVERDEFYRQGQIDTLMANIRALDQERMNVVLRYNLTTGQNQDWGFFRKYLDLLARPCVSFAVVFPSRADPTAHASPQDLSESRPNIMSLVRSLSEALRGRPHKKVFAKPFPPCLFEPDELHYLLNNMELRTTCEVDKNDGTNNLCVNPDGSFFPCMALNSDEFLFPRLESYGGLGERYHATVDRVVATPLLSQCPQCLLYMRGACQGACFAYV